MKLDLKNYKRIHADKDKTVLQSDEGHQVLLSHSSLTPKARGELARIPMRMKDGGDVPSVTLSDEDIDPNAQLNVPVNPTPPPTQSMDPQIAQAEADYDHMWNGPGTLDTSHLNDQNATQAPAMPTVDTQALENQVQPASAPAQNQDPFGANQFMKTYMGGLGEQKKGIQQEAAAQGQEGQLQAQALQNEQDALNRINDAYQQHYDALSTEREKLLQDVSQGHIDPNQFWEDKSIPGKISTAIGLILGGIGGGATHTGNPALSFLQNQIDRNITAQRLNLSNKYNLLNANRQSMQNEMDASNMSRVMLTDLVSSKLKQAAAQTMDPMARARALQAAGQLDMQSAPVIQQMAMKRALMSPGVFDSSGPGPVNLQKMNIYQRLGFMPKEDVQEATKEAGQVMESDAIKKQIQQTFNDLNQKIGAGILSPGMRNAAMWALAGKLQHATAGRFNLDDAKKQMEAILPQPGDYPSTRQFRLKQMNGLFNTLSSATPTLQRYGLINQPMQIKESAPVMRGIQQVNAGPVRRAPGS